ncbi:hypothetical protein Btru_007010 [Bulinus truncatus]|nr:hypothetical protein Btru_007010 [Bulinus truncatus]
MQVELVSRGPEVDESSAYVTGVGVSFLCECLFVVLLLELVANFDYKIQVILSLIAGIMADFRVVFMTLPWLFFSDVRSRMKTWRPWYRPAAGIDLTVTYSRDQDSHLQPYTF